MNDDAHEMDPDPLFNVDEHGFEPDSPEPDATDLDRAEENTSTSTPPATSTSTSHRSNWTTASTGQKITRATSTAKRRRHRWRTVHQRCVGREIQAPPGVSVPLACGSFCRVTLLGWKTGSTRSDPPTLRSRPPICDE